jgi:hypothetical protein
MRGFLLGCFINEDGVAENKFDVKSMRVLPLNNQLLVMSGFLLGCFIHEDVVYRS